jgi:hypothetical protein
LEELAVDREELQQVERVLTEKIKERLDEAIERVAVLQYGDDPAVEPGELVVRVYVAAQGDGEERGRAFHDFMHGSEEKLKEFRDELDRRLPEAHRLEFRTSGEDHARVFMARPQAGARPLAGADLTPVMTRLGPADLETLDTLITAGIAGNRAEAVRWAIGRIRERPAYERLRERALEIDELKAQF